MIINDLLKEQKISQYQLSKESGVSQATISDICSEKSSLENCSAITLYKISKVLNTTVNFLIEENEIKKKKENRTSFEIFKSSTCHVLKEMGDIDFVIHTLENNEIRKLYNKKWFPEALYLLGMIDYISKLHDIPKCTDYDDIRRCKLQKTIYPSGIIIRSAVMKDDSILKEAKLNAIPEFLKFNIVENEVRNVI